MSEEQGKYMSPELSSNKRELFKIWKEGQDEGANYFYLEFSLPGHPASEVIINPIDNVNSKLEYIDKMYGGDLRNKHNPEVEIISWGWFQDMNQMEYVRNNFGGNDNE